MFKGMTLQYIEQNMAHWVMQRDALALMIPSPDGATRRAGSAVTVGDYARELDGLLLMGGSDVCPETYGEAALRPEWNGDRVRDDYEIALLQARSSPQASRCSASAAAHRSSTLRMAARCTRTSRRSVPARSSIATGISTPPMPIRPRSFRAAGSRRCIPERTLAKTNSVHHQAAKDLGRDLVVEAWSEPDRIVEALRWSGPSYVFGVQWHPEFHDPGDAALARRHADPRRFPGARPALIESHR